MAIDFCSRCRREIEVDDYKDEVSDYVCPFCDRKEKNSKQLDIAMKKMDKIFKPKLGVKNARTRKPKRT